VGIDVDLQQQPAGDNSTTQGVDMSGDIARRMLAEVTRVSQDIQRCRKQDEGPQVVKSHTPCDQPSGPGEEPHPGHVNFKQAPHEWGVACEQFCSGDEVCVFVCFCLWV
jgi:hypothetical protein